jgi:CRP-like cAMP-binding protein/Zn-dependent protease
MEADVLMSKEQIKKLIQSHPVFRSLKPEEIDELASRTQAVQYFINQIIVSKGDLIDSVYIIATGNVEVKSPEDPKQPLAILSTGEAIGLSSMGFYSQTGERTATVTAKTNVELLRISLKDLHEFIKTHSSIDFNMQNLSTKVLRADFLKHVMPFIHLSPEKIYWLTERIEEVQIPANTLIFKQGDAAEICYFIYAGKVEILSKTDTEDNHVLAVLEPPMIFGETALLINDKRNATARTKEDCTLLTLHRKDLMEILESESETSKGLMIIVGQRSRPKQHSNVEEHKRKSPDGKITVILKDPDAGKYFQLSEEAKFIWDQLHGEKTLQDITFDFYEKYKVFAPAPICDLILNLVRAGFVDIPTAKLLKEEDSKAPTWVKWMMKVRRVMEAQHAFSNADKWVTTSYQKFFHFFFNIPTLIITASISILGIIAFFLFSSQAINLFTHSPYAWWLIILLIPFNLLFMPIHELAHAYATKYYNRQVLSFGIGWYWLNPVAFTDTSDMWLSEPKQRIAVNFAGIWTDIILAGIMSILAYAIDGNSIISIFLWLFALNSFVSIFKNLNPILEYDGYYILQDLLKTPNLRQAAVLWLVKILPKTFKQPSLIKEHLPEIAYWIICIVYLIAIAYLVLFIQQALFPGLLPQHVSNTFTSELRWLFPVLTVVLSSFSIWTDIRQTIRGK